MKWSLIKQAVSSAYLSKRITSATPKEMAITTAKPFLKALKKLFGNRIKSVNNANEYDKKFDRVFQMMVKLHKKGK